MEVLVDSVECSGNDDVVEKIDSRCVCARGELQTFESRIMFSFDSILQDRTLCYSNVPLQ